MQMLSTKISMSAHLVHATEKCIANKPTEQKYTTHTYTHARLIT